MKKFLSVLAVALISVTASAQVYLGGSFALDRNVSENATEFTIAPEVGYNLNSNWAIGAGVGFNHTYLSGNSANAFVISPYARYTYFRSSNNLVNLFVDGGFGLGFGQTKDKYMKISFTAYSIGFKPGIAFNLTEKFSIVAHAGFLGYSSGNEEAKAAGILEEFGLDFSTMNLNLGFYFNF